MSEKTRKSKPSPTRYCARVQTPTGIEEIGIGTELEKLIAQAKKHHDKYGLNVWVWNVRTGETLFGIAHAVQAQKAGAR
jgi:hypothetical protein